jgi:hypothetical protein
VAGRREAEERELPRCRPLHELVPRGFVAAADPGHPLAPLHAGQPVGEVDRVAGAARQGQGGAAMERSRRPATTVPTGPEARTSAA